MANRQPIRRPKLAHVAMAAGVSLGTASDALRGKGRMSDEVRNRVIAAAESMDYRPNANARTLALGHAQIVALVAHSSDSHASPRIYWPRLQAAFTERLVERGIVACTMTLDDLHKLDGLPFDLIVHAGPEASAQLPSEIRSHYRVLDLDFTGNSVFARRLRTEFESTCRAVLDHLVGSGSTRPGLVFAGAIGGEFQAPYIGWCKERKVPLAIVDVDQPEAAAHLAGLLGAGVDGLFAVTTDTEWLHRALIDTGETNSRDLPVVALGSFAPGEGDASRFQTLQPDGRHLGVQLADVAVAYLRGVELPTLTPRFLLDGRPLGSE